MNTYRYGVIVKALANQDEAVMTGVPPCKYPRKKLQYHQDRNRKRRTPSVSVTELPAPCVQESITSVYLIVSAASGGLAFGHSPLQKRTITVDVDNGGFSCPYYA